MADIWQEKNHWRKKQVRNCIGEAYMPHKQLAYVESQTTDKNYISQLFTVSNKRDENDRPRPNKTWFLSIKSEK